MSHVLDNSQYYAWCKCPVYWFTSYIAGVQKERPVPRTDALCLGSLFHNGMENWYGKRQIAIDQECIEKNTPDKESVDFVLNLLTKYAEKYPSDPWGIESIEKVYDIELISNWLAVAKLDKVAVVTTPTEIDSGIDGKPIIVPPGRYAIEHKTKSGWKPRGAYVNSWRRRKQVDFQMLCSGVNGVIVNVAEKPAIRQPTRKCQGCKETFEFKQWVPIEGQRYQCSSCNHEQELKSLTTEQIQGKPPEFFRVYSTRTPEQLKASLEEFEAIAWNMQRILDGDLFPVSNTLSCIDENRGYECDYLIPCESLTDPAEHPGFVKVPDPFAYIGLETLDA